MKDKGMRPHRVAAWGLGAVGAVLLLTVIGTLVLGPRVRSAKRTADRWRDTLPARSMQLLMNPATRVAEARRLGQARDVTAVAVLAQLSRDGDAEFRRACVWALGNIGKEEGVHALRVRGADPWRSKEAA